MSDDSQLSALMRDGMAAEARSVTPSTALTDRIIVAAADGGGAKIPNLPPRRAWQAWLAPAIAAVVVTLLVSSVFIGSRLLKSDQQQPANQTSSPQPTATAPSSPDNTPATTPPPSASATAPSGPAAPVGGPVPAGFQAVDLTWVSTAEGFALGTAPCSQAPCTSLVRTTDGGKTWVGLPAPAAGLRQSQDCVTPCVSSVRFADPMIGYIFGGDALYLTTDGGATWSREAGQADALEIGDGTVLRIVSQGNGCRPACRYGLQTAAVGSSHWQDVSLPPVTATGNGVVLVRAGQQAAIQIYGHPSGGASNAMASLLTSNDSGRSWVSRGEVCPQNSAASTGGEVDGAALAIAPDGSLAVLCNQRGPQQGQFVVTSVDGGKTFHAAQVGSGNLGAATTAIGAASATTLFAVSDAVYRSTDAGAHWQRVLVDPSLAGQSIQGSLGYPYIGFEDATTGRYISANGRTVWTTTDAGAAWLAHTFG
jgi:hypothetical protein